jgi:hypothetical protein
MVKKIMSLKPMKTYVAFIVPSPAAPEKGVAVPYAVDSRDFDALDIPVRACGFYFYDAPADIATAAETLSAQENTSKVYLLANTLLSRQDVKTLIAGGDHKSMIWDPRIEAHDRFVVTRNNAVQQVTDRHIVINSDGKQLWPPHKTGNDNTRRKKLDDVFNPVLQKNIAVKKPLTLKPKNPKAPGM